MKKNILTVFYIILTINIFGQDLPSWLEMGMSKTEVENRLNGERLIQKDNNVYIFLQTPPAIIYQFFIDEKKGLMQFWIVSNYFSENKLVEDYIVYFKEPVKNDGYWWFDKTYLPKDTIAISISSRGKAVNICYFFNNSME